MEEIYDKKGIDFVSPRWTILVDELGFKALQEHPNYKIEASTPCLFNPGFFIAEIVPTYEVPDIEAMDNEIEDVLIDTEALAIHEPFTNCVFVTEDSVEILGDEIYTWNNSGTILLGDMLTDIERLAFLLKYFNDLNKTKTVVTIQDLKIIEKKDDPGVPLENNVDKLFGDVYGIQYKDEPVVTLWWPYIMDGCGMFIAVVKDADDEETYPLIPLNRDDKISPWDEDDYDDYYYRGWYDDNYYADERFYSRT